jgi:anti-sigma regulatory factor (Ser/Thr protein kinase)
MPESVLEIPPAPEFVRVARLVAVAAARRAGIADELLDDVRLAVGEATARAVLRHGSVGTTDPVRLTLVDHPVFEVRVEDQGGAVQVADDLALALITSLPEHSDVRRTPAGDTVQMSWSTASPSR